MLYKGKEYDDNQILEILNNRDNDIEVEIEMYKEEIEKFTNELKNRKQLVKNYKKL